VVSNFELSRKGGQFKNRRRPWRPNIGRLEEFDERSARSIMLDDNVVNNVELLG